MPKKTPSKKLRYRTYGLMLMVAASTVLYWNAPKIPPEQLSHGMYVLAFLIWVISLLVLIGILVLMIVLDVKRMRERKRADENASSSIDEE